MFRDVVGSPQRLPNTPTVDTTDLIVIAKPQETLSVVASPPETNVSTSGRARKRPSKRAERSSKFTLDFDSSIYGQNFLNCFSRLYNEKRLSDVELLLATNGGVRDRLYGHRVVLSLMSTKLKSILTDNQKQVALQFTSLEEIETFKVMILFIYSGSAQIISDQIVPLLSLATSFGVRPLQESCGEALGKTLNHDNIFHMLNIADKYQSASLRLACGKFLAENFAEMMDQDILMSLDISTWVALLQSDKIKVRSETELFRAALRFANQIQSKADRIQALNELLPHIRFASLTPRFLWEIECDETLKQVPCLHSLLYQAYRFIIHPNKDSLGVKKRNYSHDDIRFGYDIGADNGRLGVGSNLIFENEGLRVRKNYGHNHSTVISNTEFMEGIHYWEFEITQFSNGMNIGVVNPDMLTSVSTFVGADYHGWDYSNTGNKIHGGNSVAYGRPFVQGDRVGVLLNLEAGTLTFYLNDTSCGVAFSGLAKYSRYSPAVSLFGISAVSINPDAEMPQESSL